MKFDKLQDQWQSVDHGSTLNISTDLLFKEVQRNRRNFDATIFWRDLREVGASVAIASFFFYMGTKTANWAWLLAAATSLWVGIFMLADRWIQRRQLPSAADSLESCIRRSLAQVDHQIWLLKNILWWYLLPLLIGVTAVFGSVAWPVIWVETMEPKILICALFGLVFVLFVVSGWFVYRLNQWAVKTELEPRRQELDKLLASLVL